MSQCSSKTEALYPNAQCAHLAGCAAAKQGKFVKFKDLWWEKAYKPRKMDDATIDELAKEAGLDAAKFKADKDGADCKTLIQNDMSELQKFKVSGTPFFFINGKTLNGALPKEEFKKIIEERIKVAEASGVAGAEYYDKEVMGKGDKQFRTKRGRKAN